MKMHVMIDNYAFRIIGLFGRLSVRVRYMKYVLINFTTIVVVTIL